MVVGYGAVSWRIDDGNEQSIPDIVILVCSAVGYDEVGAKQARPCVDDPASVTFGGGCRGSCAPVQEVVQEAEGRAQSLCIKPHLLLCRSLIAHQIQLSQWAQPTMQQLRYRQMKIACDQLGTQVHVDE